jgi:hypothetical protein
MPKQSGLGDNLYYNGFDVSGSVMSVDKISGGPALLDTTAIKQFANARIGGVRDAGMSFTTWVETIAAVGTPGVPASTTPLVSTLNQPVQVTITGGTMTNVVINGVSVGAGAGTYTLPALGTITLTYSVAPTWNWVSLGVAHQAFTTGWASVGDDSAMYFRGTALGSAAAMCVAKQANYDPTRDTKGGITAKIDIDANGFGMEWGKTMTPGLRTDNGPTTGAFFDLGAGSTFGAQAYLQLVELVGTNVDVSITHCTTSGGAFTSLIDFGSQTAIGAFRQSVSNVTTVNEFIKIVTAGTFTQAIFAVALVQNPIAGQVF